MCTSHKLELRFITQQVYNYTTNYIFPMYNENNYLSNT